MASLKISSLVILGVLFLINLAVFVVFIGQRQLHTDASNPFQDVKIASADPELIKAASYNFNLPPNKPGAKIQSITAIDSAVYIVSYSEPQGYFVVFKRLPFDNSYQDQFSSRNPNCQKAAALNIPLDYLERIASIRCPRYQYLHEFSVYRMNFEGEQTIQNIALESPTAITNHGPDGCLQPEKHLPCDYVQFLTTNSGLQDVYIVYSSLRSTYFKQKYSSAELSSEEIFSAEYGILSRDLYTNPGEEVVAVDYCSETASECIGFERYTDQPLVSFHLLTLLSDPISSDLMLFKYPYRQATKNGFKDFLQSHGLPTLAMDARTNYLGSEENRDERCQDHNCLSKVYLFATKKDYLSFEEVLQLIDGGNEYEGWSLHGGAGAWDVDRFGTLTYTNPTTSQQKDYYFNINSGSNGENREYTYYSISEAVR